MNALRQYRTNIGVAKTTTGSLMDSGANGGMAGDDVLVTAYHDHDHAQVTGIAGNSLDDLHIVDPLRSTVAGLRRSRRLTSKKKNGTQRVVTPDGWIIPLHIRNGLAYMDMRPPTQDEYLSLIHI